MGILADPILRRLHKMCPVGKLVDVEVRLGQWDSDSMVIVRRGETDLLSGVSLVAAYAEASAMTPGGNALSATNRATVYIPPGIYELTKSGTDPGLELDAEFVDLVGESMENTVITVTAAIDFIQGPSVKQTALDLRLSNITFRTEYTFFNLNYWNCQAYRIENTAVTTAADVDIATRAGVASLYKVGAFAGVEEGDAVEVQLTPGTRARSYLVANVENDDQIELTTDDLGDDATTSVIILRFNADSIYRNCRFHTSLVTTGRDNGCLFANGHLGGTWYDCECSGASVVSYGWRVTAFAHLWATMYRCVGGNFSFGGDGRSTGVPGTDPSVWAFISGTFHDCIGGDSSFGGCTLFGGIILPEAYFEGCRAGDTSFALGRECGGTFYRCVGGNSCFGATVSGGQVGTFVGTADSCVAGLNSFGAGDSSSCTGDLIRCRNLTMTEPIHLTGASIRDCELGITPTGEHCLILEDGNSKIINSTLLVLQGGSGVPINDDGSARNVVCCHCRMNNAGNDADGLSASVTNLIGTPSNVVDDDMDV